ncbi:MAG TPA: response regulator [Alphaproteobacteria bacterium]|nr:response regulator [Alphaproteobacteria bacterium]
MASAQIMVVEDESIIAEDIQAMLETLGYTVPAIAFSGEEAIRKAAETRPDLVLMDIVLKGRMDGVAAAEYLRAHHRIPVIYVTAYADEQTLSRAKLTEPLGYILKPIDERELHTAIELALYKHQAEKKVQESEQWLATTLRSISDAVLTTDAQGRVTFLNPMAEALTGWRQEEAVGCAVTEVLQLLEEEHLLTYDHPVIRALHEGEAIDLVNHDLRLRAKDGGERPIGDSVAPIRDAHGRLMGAVMVFQDITERQQFQQQLIQTQKIDAIGRLAGRVAHDFNNLLTVISLYSELLMGQHRNTDQLHRYAHEIKKAVEHATTLTNQLLALGRKQVLQPIVLNLNAVLTGMEEMLQRLSGDHIDVVMELGSAPSLVNIDPGQLEQVILNLVINARDAMPQGGTLSIATANVELDERSARRWAGIRPGAYARLTVADTGHGMDSTTQAHLFEPFFTTKPRGKGTGLGLSIVHGIIAQSGGHIAVDSALGQGTTVTIYLPLAEIGVMTRPASATSNPLLQGTETVLLVEDEEEVRAAVFESLQMRGYTVLKACNGQEAMVISKRYKGPIDLLLTDVVMPQMSGPELVKRLAPQRPTMRIILMSGYPGDALAPGDLRNPDVGFLSKPFTPETLARKVREVLDTPAPSVIPPSAT